MLGVAQYLALLLDLGLPDGDGLSLIRQLRADKAAIPIIAITARTALEDRITGLNQGADDYVVKPFDVDELVARLNAVLRRQGLLSGNELEAGNVALDASSGDMRVGDRHILLSGRERQLAE